MKGLYLGKKTISDVPKIRISRDTEGGVIVEKFIRSKAGGVWHRVYRNEPGIDLTRIMEQEVAKDKADSLKRMAPFLAKIESLEPVDAFKVSKTPSDIRVLVAAMRTKIGALTVPLPKMHKESNNSGVNKDNFYLYVANINRVYNNIAEGNTGADIYQGTGNYRSGHKAPITSYAPQVAAAVVATVAAPHLAAAAVKGIKAVGTALKIGEPVTKAANVAKAGITKAKETALKEAGTFLTKKGITETAVKKAVLDEVNKQIQKPVIEAQKNLEKAEAYASLGEQTALAELEKAAEKNAAVKAEIAERQKISFWDRVFSGDKIKKSLALIAGVLLLTN